MSGVEAPHLVLVDLSYSCWKVAEQGLIISSSGQALLAAELVCVSRRMKPIDNNIVHRCKTPSCFHRFCSIVLRDPFRREKKKDRRAEKQWSPMRPRRRGYLAPWSSNQARDLNSCQTQKESEQHVAAASKSAGFLFAMSAGGRPLGKCVSGAILAFNSDTLSIGPRAPACLST